MFKIADRAATDSDAQLDHPALSRVQKVSTILDDFIRIPGTDIRFGLDPILGILPVAGDSVASLMSVYIIVESIFADAPADTIAKMVALTAVDFVIGSIPLVGPVFDALWKNNKWCANMLERHFEQTA